MQSRGRYLPDANQAGVVAAMVLLSYALAHLGSQPGVTLAIQLPGFYFEYSITLAAAMTLVAGGLTATGMDWLLKSHPGLQGRRTIEHWMLPTLTAVIIGIVLNILPAGAAWWIGLAAGAALLAMVIVAEYISLDPGAPLYALASAGLTALSYTLFLLFVTALRLGAARLFLMVPAVFLAAALVALRSLHLRVSEDWDFPWALAIGLVCAQIAAGIHYWPATPLQCGLAVLAPLYALTSLATALSGEMPAGNAWRESGVILAGLWITAALVQ